MSHARYVIPAMTLSFSCSSMDARKNLCSSITDENIFFGDNWEEENCLHPQGTWMARTFGYMEFPVSYNFYGYYNYTLNIFLELGEEAILSVERTMNSYEYGETYSDSMGYTGTWSNEGEQISVRIDDNYVVLDMFCTLDEPMLSCEVSDPSINTASFERYL